MKGHRHMVIANAEQALAAAKASNLPHLVFREVQFILNEPSLLLLHLHDELDAAGIQNTDHFETLIGDIKAGSYSYETVQRIIKTENLWIIMLPDRVYLPVRIAGIPDEYREVIEQDIAAMVNGCRKADWKK